MKEKKKLLYVITKSNWGGAQRYVHDLAIYFSASREYDAAVALGGSGILREKLEASGIRVISLPSLARDVNPLLDMKAFFDLWKLFKQEKPDIVHLNSPKASGLGALAARIAKVQRIIFTVHGWTHREEWRSKVQLTAIRFFSWLTILFSHKIICVSEYDAKQARNFLFARDKIAVIRNSLNTGKLLTRHEARKTLGSGLLGIGKRNPLWIGTIGELHKNKGHQYAIEMVKKMVESNTDVILVIIGEGEEQENLTKLIREYKLEAHVFLISVPENAAALLRAFDLFLFPSVKEGMPYAVLEAGAAGLPVVASSVGGISEIITDMESGILVRPKDSDEIVRAINYLFDHPRSAEKFGRKLSAKIATSFSFEKMAKETERAYRE